jgi:hypothetical protein
MFQKKEKKRLGVVVSCSLSLLVTYSLSGLAHYANTLGSGILGSESQPKTLSREDVSKQAF